VIGRVEQRHPHRDEILFARCQSVETPYPHDKVGAKEWFVDDSMDEVGRR
jgi:hypothetical protein